MPQTCVDIWAGDVTDLDTASVLDKEDQPFDVLVNNAGIALNRARIADSDPNVWWHDWVGSTETLN